MLLVLGLEFPTTVALIDCINRDADGFEGGAPDRQGWIRWLIVSYVLCPVLFGYGIVLGYYWAVVKRTNPMTPRTHHHDD